MIVLHHLVPARDERVCAADSVTKYSKSGPKANGMKRMRDNDTSDATQRAFSGHLASNRLKHEFAIGLSPS
jgi:hypothetical protein